MPTIIDELTVPPNLRNSKYPWDEWTDGQARRFVKGVDFDCEPQSFRLNAYQTARKRGLSVRTARPERDVLEVQFSPVDEDPTSTAVARDLGLVTA